MKIVIIGGHLTPALSVIEALPSEAKILYVGRKYALEGDSALSLEYQTIEKKGIEFKSIKTGRLQRKLTRHSIPSLAKIPFGLAQAMLILQKFKPDVVVGFGGYVSFPVILAAHLKRIPVVIHEQTLEAGAANKLVAGMADKICISFETSRKYFPKEKTVLTGNPIRATIVRPLRKFDVPLELPVIYITGGSLGSHALNLLVSGSLSRLIQKYTVIHQTGASSEFRDFEKLSILRDGLNKNSGRYIISKFFSPADIGSILKASTMTVSRAGINTVSELIVLEKPSLLIPLPFSQKNEQMKNALFFKKLGLGEIGEQKDLDPDKFLNLVDKIIQNIDSYKLNSKKSQFPKDATGKIIDIIYAAAKNNH